MRLSGPIMRKPPPEKWTGMAASVLLPLLFSNALYLIQQRYLTIRLILRLGLSYD